MTRLLILAGAALLIAAAVANLVWVVRRLRQQPESDQRPDAAPARVANSQPAPPPAPPAAPPPAPTAAAEPEKPTLAPSPAQPTPPAPRAPVHPGSGHPDVATPRVPPPPRGPEYMPVAPVELRFSDSTARIGVAAGSVTFDEFRRIADDLHTDLRRALGEDRSA